MIWALLGATALGGMDDADACLRPKLLQSYQDDWGVRAILAAEVAEKAQYAVRVLMYGGTEYRFDACADKVAADLDVYVYEEGGKEPLARDSTRRRDPSVTFKPDTTGVYIVSLYHRTAAKPDQTAAAKLAIFYR